VGFGDFLDILERRKNFVPAEIRSVDRPDHNLIAARYQ
jgi:hypothetical protein